MRKRALETTIGGHGDLLDRLGGGHAALGLPERVVGARPWTNASLLAEKRLSIGRFCFRVKAELLDVLADASRLAFSPLQSYMCRDGPRRQGRSVSSIRRPCGSLTHGRERRG